MDFPSALAHVSSEPRSLIIPPSRLEIFSGKPSTLELYQHQQPITHSPSSLARVLGESKHPLPEGSTQEEIVIYWKTQTLHWKSHAEQYKKENTALQAYCQLLERALSDLKNMIGNLIMLSPDSIKPDQMLEKGANLRAALDTDNLETVQELLTKTNVIAQKVLLDNFNLREKLNGLYEDNQKLHAVNQSLEKSKKGETTHKRRSSSLTDLAGLEKLTSTATSPGKENTQDVLEALGLNERTEPTIDKKALGAASGNGMIPNADLLTAYSQIETLEKKVRDMVEAKFEMIANVSKELERLRCYIQPPR